MADGSTSSHRRQSMGEEIANSISHGIGFVAALVAFPVLVLGAMRHGASAVVGAAVFAATMSLLYLTSTIYHALPENRAKRVFQIPGSRGHLPAYRWHVHAVHPRRPARRMGWTLFGMIWGLAIFGVVVKSMGGIRYRRLSTALYLAMGWLVMIAAKPLLLHVPGWGLFWLAAGGVAYTAGVGFYIARRMRYAHFIWHLFVLTGTSCHFVAVLSYAV